MPTILHVSDTQFGPYHDFKGPTTFAESIIEDLNDKVSKDFSSIVQPDLVVVTGDLTESAKPDEFVEAFNEFGKFAERLNRPNGCKLGKDRVLVIPGNHDINWDESRHAMGKQNPYDYTLTPDKLWLKWAEYVNAVNQFYEGFDNYQFNFHIPWNFWAFKDLNIEVVGLNSTVYESHRPEDHRGYFGKKQLDWFREKLTTSLEVKPIRIGLLHHPIVFDPTEQTEHICVEDKKNFKLRISDRFDLLLHGHIHESAIDYCSSRNGTALLTLSTGSAVNIDKRPKGVPCQYQIIQVNEETVRIFARRHTCGEWEGDNKISEYRNKWDRELPLHTYKSRIINTLETTDTPNSNSCNNFSQVSQKQIDIERIQISPSSLDYPQIKTKLRPSYGQSFIEHETGIKFLYIPKGKFNMGSDNGLKESGPAHEVKITQDFWLAETPVTNKQYSKFISVGADVVPAFWKDPRFSDPEQPVVGISWLDADLFCKWLTQITGLSVMLPTEAQWEFAARGTESNEYPWGNDVPNKTRACFSRGRKGNPEPVSIRPLGRGPYGTLDQGGNVWEWCKDFWDQDIYEKRSKMELIEDPEVPWMEHTWHAVRGGSWLDGEMELSSSFRGRLWAACCSDCRVGFRPMIAYDPPITRDQQTFDKAMRGRAS